MLLQYSSTFLGHIPLLRTPQLHSHLPSRPYILVRSAVTIEPTEQQTPPPVPSSALKLNKFSSRITEPKSQGGSQAILYGVGLNDDDMDKPQVGISSVWYEGNTCNMHLMELSEAVKEGVYAAGMVGFRFNTIGVSDAISMGTRGMCYSLQSRDLIADSIETVMSAQWYDANISIPGCDKNMPGTIMAMGRLNRPSIMIYGGTIKPGHSQGKALDVVSAFQCFGEYVNGKINNDERLNVVRNSCPGAGACGGMYTANTMACAIETMGMSLPYSSSTPAVDFLKLDECRLAGKYLLNLIKMDLTPRDIITEKALRNALVVVMALGGSTNAVLHLIAIARSVGLNLTLNDIQKISDKTPFLADLKPSGKYVMEDLHKIGGTPAVIRLLLEEGFLDGDCLTVTGQTLSENAKIFPSLSDGQQIIRPLSNPIKKTGHIQILYGNLAPDGSVAKITGKEGLYFSGPALVFEGEENMLAALSDNPNSFKGKVIVIRGEGPKGGPGMPEMLTPTSAIMGAGLGKECALLTDGRFSGGSHGFVVGHICPEAQEGGPIGLIENGDIVTIDIEKRALDVNLSVNQFEERRAKWTAPPYKSPRGVLYKYIKSVQSASNGCVTDE
ncbi:Dihydroxy-acid dehydratase [Zostera marina]|uniref:dihydroxy-acid dehydratase n=1 Tax=Zostera marina TaxID=29655 RepID=A0A0K9NLI2_ZOSMR|nr:Dihydroxy-acid dehydratase [Zostera marina]